METLQEETSQTEEVVAEKRPRNERSESVMDTDAGGEASQ